MLKDNLYVYVLAVYFLVIGLDVIKLIRLIKKPPLDFNISRYFFRIHLIVLFCGVVLCIVLVAFEVNIFKYSAPIEYARYKEISLNNFDGFKIPGQKLQGDNRFAFITTNIEQHIEGDQIVVTSFFHPSRSYVYIDNLQNESLLRHEIYHFHITEVWARELRKKIMNLGEIPSDEELDFIYAGLVKSLNEMQREYDYDTDHGYLLGKQIKWQETVDSLLNILEPYKEPVIQF